MRLYVDGTLRQDSGPLSHKTYVQQATLNGLPSHLHTIQIRIETRAAPQPGDFIQFVQCPPAPGGSRA